MQIICNSFLQKKPPDCKCNRTAENKLLHQQHLARALDGTGQLALIMRGHPGVFARQDAALIGHKLPEQIGVLEIERVNGEVNLWLRPRRAIFRPVTRPAAVPFVCISFAWHGYLISR